MDYVHITGLRIKGKHGHYVRERRGVQEFEVSVHIAVELKKAGTSDRLRDSINYDTVRGGIEEIFARTPRYLLEKLAEEVARSILADKRAKEVTVTIQKLAIWKNGVPGVTITRTR